MTYATHQIVWSMAGVFSVLASILTFYLIYGHLRNYTAPRFQKPIVRILLMIPVSGGWLLPFSLLISLTRALSHTHTLSLSLSLRFSLSRPLLFEASLPAPQGR